MRKTAVTLLLACLGLILLIGCNEDETLVPYFTRLNVNQTCGVAPMTVQFIARASGGNPTDDLTGANAYLDIAWDFGDGTGGNGSLVYHTFDAAGEYPVTVTVRDKDGEGETQTLGIEVRADSLLIYPTPADDSPGDEPDTTIAVGQSLQFGVEAEMCGFDRVDGDYDSYFKFHWAMGDTHRTVYTGRTPRFTYNAGNRGLRRVVVTVEADQLSISRRDTITVLVQ